MPYDNSILTDLLRRRQGFQSMPSSSGMSSAPALAPTPPQQQSSGHAYQTLNQFSGGMQGWQNARAAGQDVWSSLGSAAKGAARGSAPWQSGLGLQAQFSADRASEESDS